MRMSDGSSDVCSSDLGACRRRGPDRRRHARTGRPVMRSTAEGASGSDGSRIVPGLARFWRGARRLILTFVLPILLLGPVMYGAEEIAHLLGFHGSAAQFMRFLMLGVPAPLFIRLARSAERRVGKECVSTFRSRRSPYH